MGLIKQLTSPDSGAEDKVYGVDWVELDNILSGGVAGKRTSSLLVGLDVDKPTTYQTGRLYFATDTKILYQDTGSAWTEIVRGETVIRLAQLSEKDHTSLTNVLEDQHHPKHVKTVEDHPLSVIPTMDDAHIPDLETLSYGAAFAGAQIPNLPASKITSGVFDLARIPTPLTGKDADMLDTKHYSDIATEIDNDIAIHAALEEAHHSKHLKTLTDHPLSIIPTMDDGHIPDVETLSYGAAFAEAQIPNLPASKITSGILAAARGGLAKALSPTFTDKYILVFKSTPDQFEMESKFHAASHVLYQEDSLGLHTPTVDYTIYVRTTGDDANDGLSEGNAKLTIQAAIDSIPAIVRCNITIDVGAGTFAETVTGQGKNYSGAFKITLQGTLSTDDSGTATGGAQYAMGAAGAGATFGYLEDTSKSWTVDEHQDKLLVITGGTGSGQERIIHANTATKLEIVGYWDTVPDATSTYAIKDFDTIIDGEYTREHGIEIAGQKEFHIKYVHIKDYEDGEIIYVRDFSSGSLRSSKLTTEPSSYKNYRALEVEGYSIFPLHAVLFRNDNKNMGGGVRLMMGSAPALGDSFNHVKSDGFRNAWCISALSFTNNKGRGMVILNAALVALDVQSFSRFDIQYSVIRDSARDGILVQDAGFLLFRQECEVSGCGGSTSYHGLHIMYKGYLQATNPDTCQVNNSGGWGCLVETDGIGRGCPDLSYTGNGLGGYSKVEAIFIAMTPVKLIWKTQNPGSATPRTATISSVSGDVITLTANDANRFWNDEMDGNVYAKIANTSKAPAEYAWVKDKPAANQLKVTVAGDISGWANGETISTAYDGGTSPWTELDVSPTIPSEATGVFAQCILLETGVIQAWHGAYLAQSGETGGNINVYSQVQNMPLAAQGFCPIATSQRLWCRDRFISDGEIMWHILAYVK